MEVVNYLEVSFLLRCMICSQFQSFVNLDERYEQFYYKCIWLNIEKTRIGLLNGIIESSKRLFRRRIPVSKAFQFKTLFEKCDLAGLNEEFYSRFIKPYGYIEYPRQKNLGEYHEEKALKILSYILKEGQLRTTIDAVHGNFPFIIGRPDAIYFKDGHPEAVVEVKSPKASYNKPILQYANDERQKSIIRINKNQYALNKESPVYCQIQLQMAIFNIPIGYVIYYSAHNNSILPIIVYMDDAFIQETIYKLEILYKNFYLPKLYNLM